MSEKPPKNAGKRWTNDMVKQLNELAQKGQTPEQIGRRMGRTASAIQDQGNAQGVYFSETEK
jgi:hypothetical protein